MTSFGSPGAGDATAKREQRIINGSDRRLKRLARGDQIINRPSGSKVDISIEDQVIDWQALTEDPQALLDKIGQRALAVGPEKAELEVRRWDKEMRANGND